MGGFFVLHKTSFRQHSCVSMTDFERRLNEIFQDKEKKEKKNLEEKARRLSDKEEFQLKFVRFANECILPRFESAREIALGKNHPAKCQLIEAAPATEPSVFLRYSLHSIRQGQKVDDFEAPELRYTADSENQLVRIESTGAPSESMQFNSMSPDVVERDIVKLFGALLRE